MSRAFNRIIAKFGDTVTVKPRFETVDDQGSPVYTYPEDEWFTTKALIYDKSGLSFEWLVIGVPEEVDYIACFYSSLKGSLEPGDLVVFSDGTETEIINVLNRGLGPRTDFIEVLLKKWEGP